MVIGAPNTNTNQPTTDKRIKPAGPTNIMNGTGIKVNNKRIILTHPLNIKNGINAYLINTVAFNNTIRFPGLQHLIETIKFTIPIMIGIPNNLSAIFISFEIKVKTITGTR